ncbi:MAG: AMP-binding protein [Dehalococcoidia bacterium]|nr:AMP-binding protein [Dehalococcoidia bacterium]
MPKAKAGDFFDDLEIMPAEKREGYLNQKLAEAIDYAYHHAPSAKEILDRAGVRPTQIRTIKDLQQLPITRKTELMELQKSKPPYGGLSTIPAEDVERIFISPGPIYEPLHVESIKWFAKTFYAAGFRKGDIVINSFTYHMSPAGILFHEAIRDCGATAIAMGVGNTEAQVQTMHDLKVTGFVGTPSFLMTIIKRAEEMGYNFHRDFAVHKAWFTGEMLPPSLRKSLEEDYAISTAQAYAVTEPGGCLAYECSQKSGMHFMDEYIIEIVDPETGKQLGPGEVGEIVITPLHNKTWGLIRFGTGDMSYYTTDPCPCGRTSSRLVAIVGRAGDAVKVRGMFVVTKQAEAIFSSFNQISTFQIVVGREGERDKMMFNIELKDEAIDKGQLAEDLNKKFQEVCRVKADNIEFVAKGTIPEEHKTILDERTWE